MRKPSERNEPRLEFLGEQDGEPERALKTVLTIELSKFREVERAYLARVGFAPSADVGVALCLTPSTAKDATIVQHVGNVFAAQFSREAHLDVVFVDGEQEGDLQRVCRPFYTAVK